MTRIEQSQNKVVNDGLRAWLMEIGLRLESTDLTDAKASSGIRTSLLELLDMEAALVAAEEESVFPGLMEKAPYLVCHFEQEHRKIAQLRQDVVEGEWRSRHFASREQAAGLRLAYTAYMIFVLQHGIREEGILAGSMNLNKQHGKIVRMGVAA